MNETIAMILKRRSIRTFTEQPVPLGMLDDILLAGRHAPSGGNSQFCHFTVIQSREVMEQLSALAAQSFSKMEVTEGMYKSMASAIQRAKAGPVDYFYGAPALVIVSNLKSHPNAMADSAAAIENMLVAATSYDLGSCWINQLKWLTDDETLRGRLATMGIGEEEVICGAVILGYARQWPQAALPRTGNRVTFIP